MGTPDILMCISGVFVAIELKTNTGVLSELQKFNLQAIGSCGGIAIVVMPSNFDESISFLNDVATNMGAMMVPNEVMGDI